MALRSSPALLLLAACAGAVPEPAVCLNGERLFGAPTEATGLDTAACAPTCVSCGDGGWTQPSYTAADLADWRAWTLLNPPAPLSADPYALPAADPPGADAVCAMLPAAGGYLLVSYGSTTDALAAGAQVTHYGRCGLCSSLTDLAVYAEVGDLTGPVRDCGFANLDGDVAALSTCIATIGFTEACASIWAYNTLHTRDACLSVCMAALDDPYNLPDGSLNPCLQCDEDESGAVFLAVAGRTRRNTGLASSMCRPCAEVRPLEHAYGPPQ